MMQPLCTMTCEDCGTFGVMHQNAITIFIINSSFFAVARCIFCDRVVTDSAEKEVSVRLFWEGVKILNFNTGEQITDNKTLEKI